MISKIIEEALENIVRRIEALEKFQSNKPLPTQTTPSPNLATKPQMDYLRSLGGKTWDGMTKTEAGTGIDIQLEIKKNRILDAVPETKEPAEVDTDDAGLDEEGLM